MKEQRLLVVEMLILFILIFLNLVLQQNSDCLEKSS